MALKEQGFQFGHMDWFGVKGAPKKQRKSHTGSHGTQRSKGWSVSDILAEAARINGHCVHVKNPENPNVLFGDFDACRSAAFRYEASRDFEKVRHKNGGFYTRRPRGDAPAMTGGVISMPRERIADWPKFRDHTLKVLKQKHGGRLRLVVEHLDESHPHLHFYLVPFPGEHFGVVHPGYGASRQARQEEGNHVSTSYKRAMTEWQDWLHEHIAKPFGLSRIGPKRARAEREQHLLNKQKSELAERFAQLAAREKSTESAMLVLAAQAAVVAKLTGDVQRREKLLADKQVALVEQSQKAKKEVDRLLKENAKTRAQLAEIFESFAPAMKVAIRENNPQIIEALGVQKDAVLDQLDGLGLG
jgi:hypothetical protein